MKKCKSCQSEIDSKATRCPKCQADQRNWFRKHPVITTMLVLIFIGTIASSGDKTTKSASNSPSNSNSVERTHINSPSPHPVLEVDATTLIADFDANKLNANEKYAGRTVQTSGYITNISNDIVGNYYLSLKPSSDKYYLGTTMACYFKEKTELTSLVKEEKVTVKGTMQEMSLGIVSMKSCALIE